jgi:hypothetical protein
MGNDIANNPGTVKVVTNIFINKMQNGAAAMRLYF